MRRLFIISTLCLLLIPLLSRGQVRIANSAVTTITNTNNEDGNSVKVSGSDLYVANAFFTITALTVNSATPDIIAQPAYKTANTSATTITNFLGIGASDSASVFWKTIVVTDGNTIIQHGTNIDCGGASLQFNAGDIFAIVWVSNKWRCLVLFLSTL